MAKTKKELGLDSMGVQKSMRLTDYLGDGLGQLPLNTLATLCYFVVAYRLTQL